MAKRDQLMKGFLAKHGSAPKGDPFGPIGNLPAGRRIQRGRDGSKVYEDDPDYKRKTRNRRIRSKR